MRRITLLCIAAALFGATTLAAPAPVVADIVAAQSPWSRTVAPVVDDEWSTTIGTRFH